MMVSAFSVLRSDLSAGFLTAQIRNTRIRSLVEDPTANRESSFSRSTSCAHLKDASPQAISGRTSYRQARLEFLLYSQVIPEYCTARGFGPPLGFTPNSSCS